MTYRIWNMDTQHWLHDEDGRVCEFDTAEEAIICKDRMDDLKKVNPQHRNDTYVLQAFHETD